MPKPLLRDDARRLRDFFRDVPYSWDNLQLPLQRNRNLPRLLYQTRAGQPLDILLRWFLIGVPVDATQAAAAIPEAVLSLLLESDLLARQDGMLAPTAMITPYQGILVASDFPRKLECEQASDCVLWPNPTSTFLQRFTVRRPCRSTLDLGAGCGVQAMLAAGHSETVAATDLNPRATEFAACNASLNGIANIECLTGDTFDPVTGRAFDLIVANPPFFLAPSRQHVACENTMELDQYCRRVARESPAHLREGGLLQMVMEWVEVAGERWEDRLAGWMEDTGCDAWLLHCYQREPARYAQDRIRETTAAPPEADAAKFSDWMAYYEARGVQQIHGGLLAMRKRSGRNWRRFDELASNPTEPFGDAIAQAFAARDFLDAHPSSESLLAARVRLNPLATLEQRFRVADGNWQPETLWLSLARGVVAPARLEPLVAEFIAGCDGVRTLDELAGELAAKVNEPVAQIREECVTVARGMIEHGFLLPPGL